MWRKAAIEVVAACIGRIDNGVDEIEVTVTTHQHVSVYGIKDVVLPVGVVCAAVLWTKA